MIDSMRAHGELTMPAAALRPIHVTRALLEASAGWSDNTKRGFVAA